MNVCFAIGIYLIGILCCDLCVDNQHGIVGEISPVWETPVSAARLNYDDSVKHTEGVEN